MVHLKSLISGIREWVLNPNGFESAAAELSSKTFLNIPLYSGNESEVYSYVAGGVWLWSCISCYDHTFDCSISRGRYDHCEFVFIPRISIDHESYLIF